MPLGSIAKIDAGSDVEQVAGTGGIAIGIGDGTIGAITFGGITAIMAGGIADTTAGMRVIIIIVIMPPPSLSLLWIVLRSGR